MITFDQVQLLEKKVSDAVQLIKMLKSENRDLKDENSLLEERISELENLKTSMTSEQAVIEKGIIDALSQFDELDEDVEEEENVSETSEVISTSEETEIAESIETMSFDTVETEEAPGVEE
jgi:FtsZ-binding cell division protein ZapB